MYSHETTDGYKDELNGNGLLSGLTDVGSEGKPVAILKNANESLSSPESSMSSESTEQSDKLKGNGLLSGLTDVGSEGKPVAILKNDTDSFSSPESPLSLESSEQQELNGNGLLSGLTDVGSEGKPVAILKNATESLSSHESTLSSESTEHIDKLNGNGLLSGLTNVGSGGKSVTIPTTSQGSGIGTEQLDSLSHTSLTLQASPSSYSSRSAPSHHPTYIENVSVSSVIVTSVTEPDFQCHNWCLQIPVKFGTEQMIATIDTGAPLTVINAILCKKLGMWDRMKFPVKLKGIVGRPDRCWIY